MFSLQTKNVTKAHRSKVTPNEILQKLFSGGPSCLSSFAAI
jgi:hypothetical protein